MAFTQNQVRWTEEGTVPILDPTVGAFSQSNVRWTEEGTAPVLDPEAGDETPIRDSILFGLL